ncbi:hypothetical protein HXX76_014671 [Chlamydomonas incerta]|uniref:DNA mismatch repair protein n=1 Tax=Chlamydomonas incerta TaxID=51695 RepID=A0A835SIW6_CHLIN|nr:hypothetical protein HXX76_014671 [Chlamydomonas incerta]|eukprot:KAG2424293.1 hypothetical protein HXX76_014671 [Chlamydomonas incerta]
MKQRPISAFFGAGKAKEDKGATQAKISSFFGGKGSTTPGADTAKPQGGTTPAPAPAPAAGDKATPPPPAAGAAAAAAPTPAGAPVAAPAAAPTPAPAPAPALAPAKAAAAKVPAGGSSSKPAKAAAKGGSKGKAGKDVGNSTSKAAKGKKAAGGSAAAAAAGRKRLRRVVVDEEDGDDGAAAGLEDDVEEDESGTDKGDDSDFEAEGSGSDEEFSADEEQDSDDDDGDDDDEEMEDESDGDDNAGAGKKRKRGGKGKAAAPAAKRTPAPAKSKPAAAAAAATPAAARTPAAVSAGLNATTPAHGTASKGPASATAGGRTATATPGTVAQGSAGRSGGLGGGRSAAATPSTGRGVTGGAHTPSSSMRSMRSGMSDCATDASVPEVTLGVAASMDGDAARFAERMASRFPFLHPDRIRDADKRRPDDPEYDPRTLHIPDTWFKDAKVSEAQQQWWNLKSANFDSVLLFKVGKFYEMFEMDSYVGVDVLGLAFMKGEQPHAGFPEVKYGDMAEGLARAGYRVVVVEQTETPDMLAKRNEERKKRGLKACGVVDRQKVAVLSRGTLVDAAMVSSRPDAAYVLAVYEMEEPAPAPASAGGEGGAAPAGVRIGLCAVDCASGQVLLGEFVDDDVRSCLRTQLTALQPQELVLPAAPLSSVTQTVLRNGLRNPQRNLLKGKRGEWSADKTYRMLRDREYFTAGAAAAESGAGAYGSEEDPWAGPGADGAVATAAATDGADAMDVDAAAAAAAAGDGATGQPPELDPSKRWPALLRRFVAEGVASRPAAMAALGGAIRFLTEALLDRAVLPLGRFEELPALVPSAAAATAAGAEGAEGADADGGLPAYMGLNGAALENLEILENGDGGSAGTLLSVLDHCTTPFGRRRLRQWLCRPLCRCADIALRQDAVAGLMEGGLAEAAGQARKLLAGVSDLERAITRLHASTVEGGSGRDAAHVVLYEDAAKRKVAALTGALKDLRSAHTALGKLRDALARSEGGGSGSVLLRRIVIDRCRPQQVEAALKAIEGACDWKEAAQTGRAVPEQGVDEAYDAAMEGMEAAERRLQEHLKELRSRLNCRELAYVSVNKDSHLLEVPEALANELGGEFHLCGNRKGYKRFTSNRLKELVGAREEAAEAKETALSSILARLVVKFVAHKALWVGLVEALADCDALMSLAAHAMAPPDGGPMCRPCLVPPRRDSSGPGAVFDAVALRHPAGVSGRNNGAFVPNDVRLGGSAAAAGGEAAPPFILLSGPNMGGKSTLLRQTCLAAILAQVGAWVPAESLTLSPVDSLFVRMGARDSIMTGQSTFFIELAETAAMLARATPNSLVVLDELGRGTATLDGAAVAGAVLAHLAGAVGCRGLFATHYHHLSDEHAGDSRVAVMHMACAVEGAEEPEAAPAGKAAEAQGGEEVTFLYRLTPGACPKSYGTNVARLAGLPPAVVTRAAEVSATWDRERPAGGELGRLLASVVACVGGGQAAEGAMEVDVDVAKLQQLQAAAAAAVASA